LEIRQATLNDRATFLALWKDFLIEHVKLGGHIEICDENLLAYLGLFESYIVGSLFGGTFIAWEGEEPVGILMGGETPPGGFYTRSTRGKTCTVWGIYVVPEHRRKGIA
jgi:GNAT superfamily N-acetyltransferase